MKKCIIKLSAMLFVCCTMLGCTPEDEKEKLGTIYGTVTDFSSGDPIANVNVRLNPRGEATLTGSDGVFQFNDLPSGSYSLSLSKNGYADLDDDYVIMIGNGNSVQRSIQLQKLHYSLQIVNNDGDEISLLDFGSDVGVNQKTFSIINDGNMPINYTITKTAEWIKEIAPNDGTVAIGDSKPVYVIINRGLLEDGENNSNLIITTPNTGGVELSVKATKYGVPIVTTLDITNVTHNRAACSGIVISDGGLNVTERGVCWSTAPSPTVNDNSTQSGSGIGDYSCELTDLALNTTYYVKAYAKNQVGIAYGEEKSFTTEILPTFQYEGYTYYVGPSPTDLKNRDDASVYCHNLNVNGITNWVKPTKDQLLKMYAERDAIGGFTTSSNGNNSDNYFNCYWSHTNYNNGFYDYYVDFSDGTVDIMEHSKHLNVRPIRRKN